MSNVEQQPGPADSRHVVEIAGVDKVFEATGGRTTALAGIDLRIQAGRVRLADRAVRLRQVDPAPRRSGTSPARPAGR